MACLHGNNHANKLIGLFITPLLSLLNVEVEAIGYLHEFSALIAQYLELTNFFMFFLPVVSSLDPRRGPAYTFRIS